MQGIWLTIAWGLATLLAVSVGVALLEYLRQGTEPQRPVESPLPRALNIDLDLDSPLADASGPVPTPAPPPHDSDARRAALADVLHRLQQAGPDASWIETTPMMLAPKSDTTTS